MLMSNTYLNTQFEYCEKIAKEVSKHEILMKRNIDIRNAKLNEQRKKKIANAYRELAKTFYLTDVTAGYKLVRHLVAFSLRLICMKVRQDVYQNGYGVLNACPSWVQALDKPFCLMQEVFKQIRLSKKPKMATHLFSFELLAAVNRVLDNSACELRCMLLIDKETVRSHATSLELPIENIYNIWNEMYRQSVLKLDYLLEAGDIAYNVRPLLKLTRIEKKILDLGLLYDMKIRIVKKTSFLINEELQVLMLLYKLMVAAQEQYDVTQKDGGQTGTDKTIYQSCGNVNQNNDKNLICNETLTIESHLKPRNYTKETLEIWALVYSEYSRRGLDGSFVLLQKRWYELKSLTRRFLHPCKKTNKQIPHLLLIAMAKRFPHIMTDDWPDWNTLVKNNEVYFDSDITALPEKWKTMKLHNVKENVSVNDILKELHDENDDGVQVIESEIDPVVVDSDSDSDIYNYSENGYSNKTHLNKNTIMPKFTLENNVTELQTESTLLPQILDNLDPSKLRTTIILEDDFDIEKELRIYEMNEKNITRINNEKEIRTLDYVNVSNDSEDDVPLLRIQTNDSSNDNFVKQPPLSDLDKDVLNDGDDLQSNIDNNEETKEFVIDKKLIQVPHVVLTPLEHISLWQKLSRDNVINCKRFSTKKLSEPIVIDSHQLSKCRPYMPTPNIIAQAGSQITTHTNNQITTHNKPIKIQEDNIQKKLQNKRKFIMRYLNLSSTCSSNEFWSERNIKLLEQCKPVSVTLKRVTRIAKKVELSDIDEIRRMNKTILTAQVAPMTHKHRDEHTVNKSIEIIEQNNADKEKTMEMYNCSQFNNYSSNPITDPVIANDNIKKMLKQIVVKKYTSNPILKKRNVTKRTSKDEIKRLNNSISNEICKMLDILVKRDNTIPLTQKKTRSKRKERKLADEGDSKEASTFNSIEEWQRQKSYNLKYFNIKPFSNVVNKKNKEDDRKEEEDKQMSTEIQEDDSSLVIVDDIKVENKTVSDIDKQLKDISNLDVSIKNGINEINNGINEINTGISINNGINTGIAINNGRNETITGISINNRINPPTMSEPPPLQLIGNNQNNIINSTPLDPLNNQNTTYYLIEAPTEMIPPLNHFQPVIQSVYSLASEQTDVTIKTNQTPSPIIYNDLLKKDEKSPNILQPLLTDTNIVNKASLKRGNSASSNVKRFKCNDPLTNKKVKKERGNTDQRVSNTDTVIKTDALNK